MENKILKVSDKLTTREDHKIGLHGHVQVFVEDRDTGKVSLWDEKDNTITVGGAQWILMKMFGLYLDTSHAKDYENISRDTNLVIPDLNSAAGENIGIDPANYSRMEEDISDAHFIQGFMVGNGGAGEDAITTKNTDYSFIRLRDAIPFQQTQTQLPASIAGKYLGSQRVGTSSFSKNYFIKKFDSIPHIYHSWYSEGQAWDYVDPVSPNDLGPDAPSGQPRTNRIETYVQCEMSVDPLNGDCISYFQNEGQGTALINELGLVAWDAEYGNRSIVETMYTTKVKDFLRLIFDNNRELSANKAVITLANEIKEICDHLIEGYDENDEPIYKPLSDYGQSNINKFLDLVAAISIMSEALITDEQWRTWQNLLTEFNERGDANGNIDVEAMYNQNGTFVYTTDKFLEYLSASEFNTLTNDEAQRCRLITYYTFKNIPLTENWKVLIKYRIYAN